MKIERQGGDIRAGSRQSFLGHSSESLIASCRIGVIDFGGRADEKTVQRVLRHAKSHVTKDRYIKTFDLALVAAMKKLEATVDLVNQSAPIVHRIR